MYEVASYTLKTEGMINSGVPILKFATNLGEIFSSRNLDLSYVGVGSIGYYLKGINIVLF